MTVSRTPVEVMPVTRRVPQYRHDNTTDRAVVTLNGVDHWLRKHGTEESRRKYDRLVRGCPVDPTYVDAVRNCITSGSDSLSAHVVTATDPARQRSLRVDFRRVVHDRFGIDHVTIQVEPEDMEQIAAHADDERRPREPARVHTVKGTRTC